MTTEQVIKLRETIKEQLNGNPQDLEFVNKYFEKIYDGRGVSRWAWLRWLNFNFKDSVVLKDKYKNYDKSKGIGLAFYSVEKDDIKNVNICRTTNSALEEIKLFVESKGLIFDKDRRYEQYREIINNEAKTFIDLDAKTGDFHKYYSDTKCMLELFSEVNGQCGNHPYSSLDKNIIEEEFVNRLNDSIIINNIDNTYNEIMKALKLMVNTIVK